MAIDEEERWRIGLLGLQGGFVGSGDYQVGFFLSKSSLVALILYLSSTKYLEGTAWTDIHGIMPFGYSQYAAVAADTFSSELGILSRSPPRLLTSLNFRQVPPGTNGGISLIGTLAGFGGGLVVALTSVALTPFCSASTSGLRGPATGFEGGSGWGWQEKGALVVAVTIWGGLGSLLDSALGGWFQESVVDKTTGKVVEGVGGKKVCYFIFLEEAFRFD